MYCRFRMHEDVSSILRAFRGTLFVQKFRLSSRDSVQGGISVTGADGRGKGNNGLAVGRELLEQSLSHSFILPHCATTHSFQPAVS